MLAERDTAEDVGGEPLLSLWLLELSSAWCSGRWPASVLRGPPLLRRACVAIRTSSQRTCTESGVAWIHTCLPMKRHGTE